MTTTGIILSAKTFKRKPSSCEYLPVKIPQQNSKKTAPLLSLKRTVFMVLLFK